jgi:hypothetical protein
MVQKLKVLERAKTAILRVGNQAFMGERFDLDYGAAVRKFRR